MSVAEHIRKKVSTLPHRPGIYLMRDRFGTVIYVGKARDLRKRVSHYFQPSRRMGWDLKFKALVEAIHDFDFHLVRSEPEALLLESKLIKEFHPRYNVSFRDDKNYLMLKVNLNDPIPRFTLTRLRQDDGARYFGPFPNSSALRSTLALVRREYHLRGCRPLTPNERDYKHCLYGHLKYCTAPCIANVSREQYLDQVKAACDFLEGQCSEMQEHLVEEMKKAAAAQEYERAAALRDMLADLKRTTQKVNRFERVPYSLPLAIDPERDLAELGKVLGLCGPPHRIEGFDISNISGTFKVASLVSFRNGRPDRANYRKFKIKSVEGQDDFASMAEVIRRRYSRLLKEARSVEEGGQRKDGERQAEEAAPPVATEARDEGGEPVAQELQKLVNETSRAVRRGWPVVHPEGSGLFPDLILIDGGKGQVAAACGELEKLGLTDIPVIGLAKEFEEIYRPGEKEPLRLSHETGALKLLQRVRDESHRLANTYNAELRLKKISESILDEFPSIGQQRKAALLKKFGSVQRIRMASVEQIAEVPGFGGKAAAELKAFLEARQ
ncbi:MAG TPA: excinuclease ABC subunit UvrC [Candidatus Sulfotelmatobacter sp.]|nr:excinuclease ABC subunit UvrC [Candidatus Sulfotelmatobacter sp.]